MSKFAWVTLATNDSYSLGALVVANSLKRVHTAHQLAVLITPGVSESMKTRLRSVFNVVQEVNLLDSKDEANLALLKRPELGITFTKLHCWRLTQFEKCVFLDADTLVLRNCDELFEREELSAAPDVGWPDCFNSGVYVYRPSLDTFSSLIQFAVSHGSFDGGDQGLLNSYFSDWAHTDISKHLPFIYNTSTVASYSYLPAFKQFGQNTKILHFIGTAKPWLQNFNSETRKVYVPHGYQHLTNFLQFWWDVFCEDVHSRLSSDMSGLAGALSQLHLGEPKSIEQEAYEEHMRRQCWETGNIDYMGRDSFDNIWRRIQATLDAKAAQTKASTEAQSAGAAAATPIRAISPAPPKHRRSAKSRSRSTTPKRDPRDRSPTPQPEDNVPVEKKEVQIEPPILEEEDSLSATSGQVQDQGTVRSRPMTPLTEKVFAGPQATSGGVDVVDAPQKEAVTPPRSEPSPAPQAASSTPPPPQPMREEPPVAIPSPVASAAPSPSRSSPRPQPPPLQVAEESMAGKPYKTVASEPVRTVRRKQLVSPPQAAPAATVTTTSTMTQTKTKPRIVPAKTATTVSSIPIKPIRTVEEPSEAPPSLIKRTTNSVTHTNATVKPQTKTLPTIASSLTSSSQQASSPLVPSSLSPISQDGSKAAIASSTLEDQLPPSTSPPVPPRRKRESKVAQIAKFFRTFCTIL
ncbi:proline-rich protein 36-like isoform X7 [Uranotaenia lowii]|uniref:proline-rich protein 36-like isoform X7 n=1 Tax=Uranotaenia lowii TaxID=190385 RepID=UPI002478CCD3|nr:proline-rich protein 36-like isoform X7 [Uranotaenia lowii]